MLPRSPNWSLHWTGPRTPERSLLLPSDPQSIAWAHAGWCLRGARCSKGRQHRGTAADHPSPASALLPYPPHLRGPKQLSIHSSPLPGSWDAGNFSIIQSCFCASCNPSTAWPVLSGPQFTPRYMSLRSTFSPERNLLRTSGQFSSFLLFSALCFGNECHPHSPVNKTFFFFFWKDRGQELSTQFPGTPTRAQTSFQPCVAAENKILSVDSNTACKEPAT